MMKMEKGSKSRGIKILTLLIVSAMETAADRQGTTRAKIRAACLRNSVS